MDVSTRKEPAIPREQFVRQVIEGLPLAEAVLRLSAYALDPDFLAGVFERHRGRSYEDTLCFARFTQLIGDALLKHKGSLRKSAQRAVERDQLPVCQEALYGKLRRVPLELSEGLLLEGARRLEELLPVRPSNRPLPASLSELEVVLLDGKKTKRLAKRMLPARLLAGKLFGGKILVAMRARTGMAVAMAANLDGEANDCRLVPDLLPQARTVIQGPRLWVADRQFGDLVQIGRFTEENDYFLIRYHPKLHFHPDPKRPAKTRKDSKGRTVTEEWGWLGRSRSVEVRRITLERKGDTPIILITNLLDGDLYPATDLLEVYLRRWNIEGLFQQVVEVFHLKQLIGSTAPATVFQAAYCLLLYNMIQVIMSYLAAAEARPVETISGELLFDDIQEELISLYKLADPLEIVDAIPQSMSLTATIEHLRHLLQDVWKPRWTKSVNKKPRPHTEKVKKSGAHTSIHRVMEQHKAAKAKAAGKSP
jgi:hypothetical protein